MSEERPVRLKFFKKETTHQFTGLCTKLGISTSVAPDESDKDADIVTTTPMKLTEKRKLIAAWSDASIERL